MRNRPIGLHIVRVRVVTVTASSILAVAVVAAGCAAPAKPTTRPAKLSDRTDKAIADPFGYSPSFDRTDISGGDIGSFDKEGMNRDLNHVLNP